jgi:chloramphenicol-sensitive protein RarD
LPISFGTYGLIKKNVTISSDVAMFVETIIVTPFVLIFILFLLSTQPSDYTVSQIIYLILSGL